MICKYGNINYNLLSNILSVYKKVSNKRDSAVAVIVGMCITGYLIAAAENITCGILSVRSLLHGHCCLSASLDANLMQI